VANILIADSDLGVRKIIAESLRDTEHTLYQAEDGEKAVELIHSRRIQAAILDSDLPGKDGLEILKEIEKSGNLIPAIVMIGLGDESSGEFLERGAFGTISKPFGIQELKKMISEAVPHSSEGTDRPPGSENTAEGKKRKWNLAIALLGILVLAASLGIGVWKFAHVLPLPVRIFAVPYGNISGITFDGKSLWTCDWFSMSLYRHNPDAVLSVRDSFAKENFHPTGIAWDGKNIWSVSSWSRKMSRHKAGGSFNVEDEFAIPFAEPSGLYFDGKYFWLCDARQSLIAKCLPEGKVLKVLSIARSPAPKPVGIYKDRKFLWTADSRSGFIYKLNAEEDFKVMEVYSLPAEILKEKIACFAADGENFWIGTEGSRKVYAIRSGNLKLIGNEP
jgi:CheY-like chemotaxis protein